MCICVCDNVMTYVYYIGIWAWMSYRVNWSRYRPGVAQRVGRSIALLFHDRGTRRGWVVSSTPRPHFTPRKDRVPILEEAGWAPGPVWTGGKSRPHQDSIPDRPARSQSLYRLSYPAHVLPSRNSKLLHVSNVFKNNNNKGEEEVTVRDSTTLLRNAGYELLVGCTR